MICSPDGKRRTRSASRLRQAAFFDHGERSRESAGTEQDGKIRGAGSGEVAADFTSAAGNGLANDRGADHLAVEDDGEAVVDVCPGHVAEAAGAERVEGEGDNPLAGLLIGSGARISEIAAVHVHPLADGDLLRGVILHGEEFVAWRWADLAELPEIVVPFKRQVYTAIVAEFASTMRISF